MKKIKITLMASLLLPFFTYSSSIFEFKPREQIVENELHIEAPYIQEVQTNVNVVTLNEEQISLIREIIKETFIELFFDGKNPKESLNQDEIIKVGLIDLASSKIVGEVGNSYLIKDIAGELHLVNKSIYLEQQQSKNQVLNDLFREEVKKMVETRTMGVPMPTVADPVISIINENNNVKEEIKNDIESATNLPTLRNQDGVNRPLNPRQARQPITVIKD